MCSYYSRRVAAFQARSLDIVTQVIEPLEDFFTVERVKAKFEAKRLQNELARKEKEMEEKEKKRDVAVKKEEREELDEQNEAVVSKEGEEKDAGVTEWESGEKIEVTVTPLIARESDEEMEVGAMNMTQPKEKEVEVKEEPYENEVEVKREAEEEPVSMYDKVKSRTNKREAEEDCIRGGEEARKISKQIFGHLRWKL